MAKAVDVLICPNCESSDVRKTKGWAGFITSVILFGIFLVLAATIPDDGIGAGSQALAVIMFFASIYYLIRGRERKKQCKQCGKKW